MTQKSHEFVNQNINLESRAKQEHLSYDASIKINESLQSNCSTECR